MNVSDMLAVATCVNCSEQITVTDVAVYHTRTWCLSCRPIRCIVDIGIDTWGEPADLWTGPRAEA